MIATVRHVFMETVRMVTTPTHVSALRDMRGQIVKVVCIVLFCLFVLFVLFFVYFCSCAIYSNIRDMPVQTLFSAMPDY